MRTILIITLLLVMTASQAIAHNHIGTHMHIHKPDTGRADRIDWRPGYRYMMDDIGINGIIPTGGLQQLRHHLSSDLRL
jgi:hypothetical protein